MFIDLSLNYLQKLEVSDLGFFSSYIRVIDIVLAAIIIYGAYKGFKRGFLLELISTVVLLVGATLIFFAVAALFTSTKEYVGTSKGTVFFMYFFFFILGTMGLNHMGKILQEKIDYSVLDDLDNVAALLLGGLKYATGLALLLGLFNSAGLGLSQEVTEDSFIYPALLQMHDWLIAVGEVIAPSLQKYVREIDHLFQSSVINKL